MDNNSIFFQVQILDNEDPLMLGRVRARLLIDNYQDIIRGIISVTTVGTEDLPDASEMYDRRNLNVKFELERGENIDEYMRAVLIPQIRKIRGMRVLHYGKIEKVR